MNLLKLCRNTIYNTIPFYKLKVGEMVYLFQTKKGKRFRIDDEAGQIEEFRIGKVKIRYSNDRRYLYLQKDCAVLKENT